MERVEYYKKKDATQRNRARLLAVQKLSLSMQKQMMLEKSLSDLVAASIQEQE